jgi:sugar phosphate isomerase/epimerase
MKLTLSGRIVETAQGSAISVTDFIRMARQTGYDAIDLRYSQFGPDAPEALLKQIEQALDETGIEVALMNAGGITNEESLQALLKIAAAARRLRCDAIRISGPVEMCRKAADAVAPKGIRLCSQIHTGGEYETVALTKETLAKVGRGNFGIIVEPANLMLASQPYDRAALSPIDGSVFGVNIQSLILVGPNDQGNALSLKDGTKVYYKRVPLGQNKQFNLDSFFAGLKGIGFGGFVNVLEPLDPAVESSIVARRTAETLRPKLG